MWILTQNGKRILSTEGLEEINVANPFPGNGEKTDYAVMIKRKTDGKAFALGFYKYLETAVEIVENIFSTQADYITDGNIEPDGEKKINNIVIPPKTFRMPADTNEVGICS